MLWVPCGACNDVSRHLVVLLVHCHAHLEVLRYESMWGLWGWTNTSVSAQVCKIYNIEVFRGWRYRRYRREGAELCKWQLLRWHLGWTYYYLRTLEGASLIWWVDVILCYMDITISNVPHVSCSGKKEIFMCLCLLSQSEKTVMQDLKTHKDLRYSMHR